MTEKDDRLPPPLSKDVLTDFKRELFFGSPNGSRDTSGRFKPGQSGNPKGRPKGKEPLSMDLLPFEALLLREASRTVTMREGGRVSRISHEQALIHAISANALKMNHGAQRLLVEILREAQRKEAAAVAKEHELFEWYCEHWHSVMAEAARKGEPAPKLWPHPDDIIFEPDKRVRIVGPLDADEAARYDTYCQFRDVLLLQNALGGKLAGSQDKEASGALLAALILNDSLPKRMQLDEARLLWRVMRQDALPKRELLKQVHQAWRQLGVPMPRGKRFLTQSHVQRRLECAREAFAMFKSGELDAVAMSRGVFDDAALSFLEKHGLAGDDDRPSSGI